MNKPLQHKALKAQIFNLRFWVNNIDPETLQKTFEQVLKKNEFSILNFSEHFFPVQGYTAIWLLAESHLAIHTFPQDGWSYVELSGCNALKTNQFKNDIETLNFAIQWDTRDISVSSPNNKDPKAPSIA